MNKNNKLKFLLALSFIALVGTYNAVVINSASHISSNTGLVKRLDEVMGVVHEGRVVASEVKWQKLTPDQTKSIQISKLKSVVAAPNKVVAPSTAAVQEDLSLNLVEVINPVKWLQGVEQTAFSGSLVSKNGIIESLNASLPDGLGLSVSFTEMEGNVFEYEIDGKFFSGMLYQVDQSSYMVTLTNGPLEGTRLRFNSENAIQDSQLNEEFLAEAHNVEVGTFGEAPVAKMEVATQNTTAKEAASFSF